jgi:hypothetical protein
MQFEKPVFFTVNTLFGSYNQCYDKIVPDSRPVQLCVIPRSHITTIQLVRLLFKANQLNRVYM